MPYGAIFVAALLVEYVVEMAADVLNLRALRPEAPPGSRAVRFRWPSLPCTADAFAREALGSGDALVRALETLSADSLTNLAPHPFYDRHDRPRVRHGSAARDRHVDLERTHHAAIGDASSVECRRTCTAGC
jgi:hypothetical protein